MLSCSRVLDCLRVLWLPLDADQRWRKEEILTGGEIKTIIEAVYGPLELVPDSHRRRHAATPSPMASVKSASFILSVNPSAPPVIAFARPPMENYAPACLRRQKPTCVPCYAPVVMTNG